jgi:prepilin-type N-terminal cleavage/methylation domain-containing protein
MKARAAQIASVPAFTLVELLVTVAIIAILAALLAGSLGNAKESARTVLCQNNNYQIALATGMYATDNRNCIPSAVNWLFNRDHSLPNFGDFSTGRIYPYLTSKDVYMCPTDRADFGKKKGMFKVMRAYEEWAPKGLRKNSYVMNCNVCHRNSLDSWNRPSLTMLYFEMNMVTNDCLGMGNIGSRVMSPGDAVPRIFSSRHKRCSMFTFGDLHAEKRVTLTKEGFEMIGREQPGTEEFWVPDPNFHGGLYADFPPLP